MSTAVLEAIAGKLFDLVGNCKNVTILWHAGEPLVLPPAYYEQAIQIILQAKPDDLGVQFAFVTNGTRINDSWIDFFRKHRLQVGVSVDGPQFIHDAQRVTRSGRGTFGEVMRGISHLRSANLNFYVISVLTSASLAYPREMYEFYAANGIRNICFNIDEIEGPHTKSSLSAPDSVGNYKAFLTTFLKLAAQTDAIENVRELSNMVGRLRAIDHANPGSSVCNDQVEPFGMINVAFDGSVSTFSPELLTTSRKSGESFVIGNLLNDSVDDIVNSPVLREMSDEVARGVQNCKNTCEYFLVCGGGAPSNKYFETGSFESTETLYCKLTQKAVADVVLDLVANFPKLRSSQETWHSLPT